MDNSDLLEVCFSLDTTGSMSWCFTDVNFSLQNTIRQALHSETQSRVAVIVHGDYCDTYVTKHMDFTTNGDELVHWLQNIERTHGGDGDECYELVLQEVQSLSWTPGSKRMLVVVGDSIPHEPGYKCNGKKYNINWKEEVLNLLKLDIGIIGVKCDYHRSALDFFNAISTTGRCLKQVEFVKVYDEVIKISSHLQEAIPLKAVQARLKNTVINRQLSSLISNGFPPVCPPTTNTIATQQPLATNTSADLQPQTNTVVTTQTTKPVTSAEKTAIQPKTNRLANKRKSQSKPKHETLTARRSKRIKKK